MTLICHLKIDPETSVHKPVVNYLWEFYEREIVHSCLATLFWLIYNCYAMSDSPWLHELYHTKFLSPPRSSRICSTSCPLSRWCHPTIWFSVIPFSSCLQTFPTSGSFPMSQFFASCGQRTGTSASVSVLPMNIQNVFPLQWIDLISLQSEGLSRVFSTTIIQKHLFLGAQLSLHSKSPIHT